MFVFAEKSGLDAEVVKIGLKQIYTHPAFSHYINKIANRDFDNVNFNMAGGYKDATIFQQAFANAGVAPQLSNLLQQRYRDGLSQGMENKDWSAIYEVVRRESSL